MTRYKCFMCNHKISSEQIGKRVRCPYCGSKMLYKPRNTSTKIKAR
ncbi:DNA-directed RNA polymerase subunit P [Candidatus Woesearchaeota archaeon]|nr:DNA-directed RNA polymerase subunit P [Candidatus Woesearchaeota archaeon]